MESKTINKKTITIAIISYEREAIIRRAIKSLTEQSRLPDEILVIDSSKNPMDPDSLIDLKFRGLLNYIHIDGRKIIPVARNIALQKAKGDVIAYLDDDAVALPKFVETIVASFESNDKLGCIGGPTINTDENLVPLKKIIRDTKKRMRIYPWGSVISYAWVWVPPQEMEVDTLQGGNMSFPSDLLRSIRGFDENYESPSCREETDVCVRIRRLGYQCIYHPDVFVYHIPNQKGGITDYETRPKDYFRLAGYNYKYFSDKFFPKWLSRTSWILWSRNPPSIILAIALSVTRRKNYLAWHKSLWSKAPLLK